MSCAALSLTWRTQPNPLNAFRGHVGCFDASGSVARRANVTEAQTMSDLGNNSPVNAIPLLNTAGKFVGSVAVVPPITSCAPRSA